MFGAATNTNKFCTATGGAVLARGEHMTGGLMAARSLAAARGLLAAHVGGQQAAYPPSRTHPANRSRPSRTAGSVDRVAGCINSLRIFFNLAPGISKVYSCASCWRFERCLTRMTPASCA